MSSRKYLNDAYNEIDACVFNGDMLFEKEERDELRKFALRWLKAIDDHESHPETNSEWTE